MNTRLNDPVAVRLVTDGPIPDGRSRNTVISGDIPVTDAGVVGVGVGDPLGVGVGVGVAVGVGVGVGVAVGVGVGVGESVGVGVGVGAAVFAIGNRLAPVANDVVTEVEPVTVGTNK